MPYNLKGEPDMGPVRLLKAMPGVYKALEKDLKTAALRTDD